MNLNRRYNRVGLYILSFALPFLLFGIILKLAGIYPFGGTSFLLDDLNYQYIDFFCYLKDVLKGEASILYSFSNSLGGNMIPLVAYYLFNPLNLLVVLFSKEKMDLCITLIAALKIGLSGTGMMVLLRGRYPKLEGGWQLMLCSGYALMGYTMIQISNIMWIDGLILLPLIILGVYRTIRDDKVAWLFWGLFAAVLTNWYIAYKLYIFAGLFFIYEILIEKIWRWKLNFRFLITLVLSLFASAFLFIPAVVGQSGSKVSVELWMFRPYFHELRFWKWFAWGVKNATDVLPLFCGSITVILFVLFFVRGNASKWVKTWSAVFFLGMVFCCVFNSFETMWNGFMKSPSYYSRLSFMPVFLMVYLAADYLVSCSWNRMVRGVALVAMCVELCVNGLLSFKNIYSYPHQEYENYSKAEQQSWEKLSEKDSSWYRVEQTKSRISFSRNVSCVIDESLQFGWKGIAHYSSTFDHNVLDFTNALGYQNSSETINEVLPILSSNSLLGVKYVRSDRDLTSLAGMTLESDSSTLNGKQLYSNSYALSLGTLVADTASESIQNKNSFLYQNQLFSNLLGRNVELYKKIDTTMTAEADGVSVTVPYPEDTNDLVYGYFSNGQDQLDMYDTSLMIDGEYNQAYFGRFATKVFPIARKEGNISATVALSGNCPADSITEAEFYYLDMDVFKECIDELKNSEFEVKEFADGKVSGNIRVSTQEASANKKLLLTIPNAEGWIVKVNGKKVSTEKAGDCLMVIPLEEGENQIEAVYHVPGMATGVLCSVLAVSGFVVWRKRIKQSKSNEPYNC